MSETPKREDSAAFVASAAHGATLPPGKWSGSLIESAPFRLSRGERDHIAGHVLDSINDLSGELMEATNPHSMSAESGVLVGSNAARKIAALSNLLGDIGWEREALPLYEGEGSPVWTLGELFPVAQLRPWLEEWQRQDAESLVQNESNLETALVAEDEGELEVRVRKAIAKAQTKLGTGAILLARIEKWMASHGN